MAISTVKATVNGQVYNLTYNSATGKYEATVTAPSTTSYHQSGHYFDVRIEATDTAGNTAYVDSSDATLGTSLRLRVKETTAPTCKVTSPSSGALIANNRPSITVQLRDGESGIDISTFTLRINSGAAISSTSSGVTVKQVSGGYDVTYTPTSALSDGAQTVSVSVKDNDGNSSTAVSSSFTVDTVPPTLNITAPENNFETNSRSVTVSGMTNDATSSPVTVSITVNGAAVTAPTVKSDGSFTTTVTCSEGENTIVITSTDSAGKSTSVTRKVYVDTGAPEFISVTLTPNPVNTGATYVISVEVE